MKKELFLILGGVRSGKSSYAQQMANNIGKRVLFLATAEAGDNEMAQRIARHKASRPASWITIEEQINIAEAIRKNQAHADAVIIDCVTIWLSNVLMHNERLSEKELISSVDRLIDVYEHGESSYIIVSGEVGMGIVPEHPLGRIFRDYLGFTNQRLAGRADRVVLMVAGIPIDIKK